MTAAQTGPMASFFAEIKPIQQAVNVIAESRDAIKRSPNIMTDRPDYREYVEFWTGEYHRLKAEGWTLVKGKGWQLIPK